MSRTVRWYVAGLVVLAVFAGVIGIFVLTGWLHSSADRWTGASAVATALAGFAALWGQWWAAQAGGSSSPDTAANGAVIGADRIVATGNRSVAVGRDNTGIVCTGDYAHNTQDR